MTETEIQELARAALDRAGSPVRGPLMNAVRELNPDIRADDVDVVVMAAYRLRAIKREDAPAEPVSTPRRIEAAVEPPSPTPTEEPMAKDGLTPRSRAVVQEVTQKMVAEDADVKSKAIKKTLREKFGLVVPVWIIDGMRKAEGSAVAAPVAPKRLRYRDTRKKSPKRRSRRQSPPAQPDDVTEVTEADSTVPMLQIFKRRDGRVRVLIDMTVSPAQAGRLVEQMGESMTGRMAS